MRKIHWLVIGILAPISLAAWAEEGEIKKADVPAPVLDALSKRFPKGQPSSYERETEDNGVVYEIKLVDGARQMQVEFQPDGRLVEEEEILPAIDALPAAVKNAFARSKYAKWTVRRVKRVFVPEPSGYALNVANGPTKGKILFDASGKLLKEKFK